MSKVCLFNLLKFQNNEKSLVLSKDVFQHSGKVTIWAKFGFSSFWNFKAFKSLHFCQKMCLVSLSPNRQLTKWTKFVFFQVFEIWSCNALKTSYFCQKRCLSSFPPSGRLTKWAKFAFSSFRALKSSLLSKEVFGYVLTKRTAYKMNKVCPFRDFQASGHSTTCCQNIFK